MNEAMSNRRSVVPHPLLLALVLAGVNALKPPIIDDGIYLDFARHILEHPTDPYGFESGWYHWFVPAIGVLCPPVVPYWLALGMAVLGKGWIGLKLWMFPWCLLWTASMFALLRRWAIQTAAPALWMMGLSPLILPGVNMMLDIPMFGLVLAAVLAFARACDPSADRPARTTVGLAILAGLLLGMAMETKFNAATGFAAIGLYALIFGRIRLGLVAILVGAGVFGAAESAMVLKYGHSHFFYMLGMNDLIAGTGIVSTSEAWANLWIMGCVCPVFVMVVAWAIGAARWQVIAGSLLAVGSMIGLVFVDATAAIWIAGAWGVLALGSLLILMVVSVWRPRETQAWFLWAKVNVSTELFLVAWLVVEAALTMGISPFAAARRFIGIWTLGTILAARLASHWTWRKNAPLRTPQEQTIALACILPFSAALGLIYWSSDLAYGRAVAKAFHDAAEAARIDAASQEAAPAAGPTIWSVSQWSGLYFSDRLDMRQMAPDQTVVQAGEYVVIPTQGLFSAPISVFPDRSKLVATIEISDAWPVRTIPEFYGGGGVPLGRQSGPRVVLMVVRSNAPQVCPTQFSPGLVAWWAIERKRPLPEGSIRAILEAVLIADPATREKVIAAIYRNQPLLIPAMKLENPRLRMLAVDLIRHGPEASWSVPTLQRAAKDDPNPIVRQAAAQGLAK